MKTRFRMTDDQFNRIMAASRPVPLLYLPGGVPMGPSSQEVANGAWRSVADELGVAWDSIESAGTGDEHDILAEAK